MNPIETLARQLHIEAIASLTNGNRLAWCQENGEMFWKLNGLPITVEEAQRCMRQDQADKWDFVAANGQSFEVRRPTTEQELAYEAMSEKKKELAVWNALVDAKKEAKRARKAMS